MQEKFGLWIKTVPKSLHSRNSGPGWAWRTAERFQIEIGVPLFIHTNLSCTYAAPRLKQKMMGGGGGGRRQWVNYGRDPLNQNFWKFQSKTQWICSVQPEKFWKHWSTFWGGPLFLVGLVRILVEWIAPYILAAFSPRLHPPPPWSLSFSSSVQLSRGCISYYKR